MKILDDTKLDFCDVLMLPKRSSYIIGKFKVIL